MKKATEKNDVQIIEFILKGFIHDDRNVAKIALEVSIAMQEEKHTYNGKEVFYVHKDEVGTLVMTMESTMQSRVEEILNNHLEKEDIQKCMQLLMTEQPKTTFETLKVKGSDGEEYASIMKHTPKNQEEEDFMELLKEAMLASIEDFEVFACDPSIDENGKLQFVPGCKPAVGYSYNQLERIARKNGLRLGSNFEYVLFLATIINLLIEDGWSEAEAWKTICVDSEELGHYSNSKDAKKCFEMTGVKYDMANTYKILADGNNEGYWRASGFYNQLSTSYPISYLNKSNNKEVKNERSVGWYVFN